MRSFFLSIAAATACAAAPADPPPPPPAGGGLYFATTGDTRPDACDATDRYPKETIARIARSMKALGVQFALDLGDHMYVCNGSLPEAQQQMGFYMDAIAQGPAPFYMTLGNHEAWDVNYRVYMAALNRPQPWYSFDRQTPHGLARFVVIADDAWGNEQADWLEATLADADVHARYTIIARHHPMTGSRTGAPDLIATVVRHRYSLILTAHTHEYSRDGRHAIIGLGGAPSKQPPGFATIAQADDGQLVFTLRDIDGNPVGVPWSVTPQ